MKVGCACSMLLGQRSGAFLLPPAPQLQVLPFCLGHDCRITEISLAAACGAGCWDSAESRKESLDKSVHTPSNRSPGREPAAGNPPYVFLYNKELQTGSLFLCPHLHRAGNYHLPGWETTTRSWGAPSSKEIVNLMVWRRVSFSLVASRWTLCVFVCKDRLLFLITT